MKGFLEDVARDLYTRFGDGISDCAILFPSQRTRLFFTDALARLTDHPVWQPRWMTIDRMMTDISGLKKGDRVRMVTELYKIYAKHHPEETFDKFYFWGDMLLQDFDTIDKYLIDADQLFCNIKDIKEIEADLSYLTDRQLKILQFWSSFGDEAKFSKEQRKFLNVWRTLLPIYHEFRQRLTDLGIAYTGMIHRAAAEKIRAKEASLEDNRHYVVAGFNALSQCEKELFKFLSKETTTDFYWDYDDYYVKNDEQEAGMFIRQNIVQFPQRTDFRHDGMAQPKTLTAVAAVSNAVQCKYTAQILSQLAGQSPTGRLDKETAVVLTDENLLMPLLYALPKQLGEVNVTMGYPLRQTMAYTFVERLIELQNHCRAKSSVTFYHVDVLGLLAHPYLQEADSGAMSSLREKIITERRISVAGEWLQGSDLLRTIFSPAKSWTDLSDYLLRVIDAVIKIPVDDASRKTRYEYLTVLAEEIVKMRNSLNECDVKLSVPIYTSLLRRHLQTVRIPFKGEPLSGIQVMGILETRNLDFKNVIILSMTDDNFPGNRLGDASYVPYNLRTAYELPTTEHHEGVYAYYFYRLIQRAENIHMVYCAHADEKSTGEPSRYIRQLDYESGFPLQRVEVGVDVNLADEEPIVVPKDEAVMRSLSRFTNPESKSTLSPSAFARYINCPLSFYFYAVAMLSEEDEISEEVDARMFGTILHGAAQTIYTRVKDEANPADKLSAMIRSGEVTRAVDDAINEHYLHSNASKDEYTGNLLMVEDIVSRYIKGGVMHYDITHNRFTTTDLEQWIAWDLPFEVGGKAYSLHFGGIADRIDLLDNGIIRVVDYKTGGSQLDFKSLDALFHDEARSAMNNVLQIMIYAMVLHHTRGRDVVPALYYVRDMNRSDFTPELHDASRAVKGTAVDGRGVPYSQYCAEFEQLLAETIAEIFNPDIPFRQVEDSKLCAYCAYRGICRR